MFLLCVFYHNKTPYRLHLFISKTMIHHNVRSVYQKHVHMSNYGGGCCRGGLEETPGTELQDLPLGLVTDPKRGRDQHQQNRLRGARQTCEGQRKHWTLIAETSGSECRSPAGRMHPGEPLVYGAGEKRKMLAVPGASQLTEEMLQKHKLGL